MSNGDKVEGGSCRKAGPCNPGGVFGDFLPRAVGSLWNVWLWGGITALQLLVIPLDCLVCLEVGILELSRGYRGAGGKQSHWQWREGSDREACWVLQCVRCLVPK